LGKESVLFELPRDQQWQEGQNVVLEFDDDDATVWPLGNEQEPRIP
jgi:hypothetical protein